MTLPTPRPDHTTPTRVTWDCAGCGIPHSEVRPRDAALLRALILLERGLDHVILEDATAAEIRDANLAEAASQIAAGFVIVRP